MSIPRLELMAAVLSAKVGSRVQNEIDIPVQEEPYWTDSKVVLGYLNNTSKIKLFVANQISFIKERTKSTLWSYVKTNENPVDIASRRLEGKDTDETSIWLRGPKFLWSTCRHQQ